MATSRGVEGRWTIAVSGGEPVGQPSESEARRFGFEIVPVVPCDDAAVERAAKALTTFARERWGWGTNEYEDIADAARMVLRAAGAQP